jgi:hypothetical protein
MRTLLALAMLIVAGSEIARSEGLAASEKKSVRFDGQTLLMAFEQHSADESLEEFIPAGENIERWTHLAAIRQYQNLHEPGPIVKMMAKRLKEKNPQAPFSIIENPTTGAVIIDFVTWPEDGSFAEFNIFKYSKRAGGGLVAEQYALRAYEDWQTFLKGLRPVRERLVDLMAKDGLQQP